MPDRGGLTRLATTLAGLYEAQPDARGLADRAGLVVANIDISGAPRVYFWAIVREADKTGKVAELVTTALEDYPGNENLLAAQRDDYGALRVPIDQPVVDDVSWKPALGMGPAEKLMSSRSTFLPVSYLSVGVERARAVARVLHENGSTGSGFLVAGDRFVTNHHVISTIEQARAVTVQFNYQDDPTGRPAPTEELKLLPDDGFFTSPLDGGDDLTVVRIDPAAVAVWGAVPLATTPVAAGDRVTIVQHPEGAPKKIALHRNVVTYADDSVVQYLTDTLPGSSGSPIFDSTWSLVGVHHAGGSVVEPKTGRTVFRNEGIALGRLVAALEEVP